MRSRPSFSLDDNTKRILIPLKPKLGLNGAPFYNAWPRIWRELVQRGIRVGKQRVQRLMQQHGIRARSKRRFRVVTTDSGHDLPIAPNLLDRNFTAKAPNQAWTGDITYIATDEGWLFLAVVLDLFSRKVVGWSMRGDLHRSVVIDALEMAWYQRRPQKGALIFHSDRGSQYASEDFRQLLDRHGIRPSMSRRGNCWDNAVTETLFGSLKVERLHGERFPTLRAAKDAVLEWLLWYNGQRMHSTLNYVSPAQYEQDWKQTQQGHGTDGLPESMEETMNPFLPPFPQTLEIACGDSHTSTATTTTGI